MEYQEDLRGKQEQEVSGTLLIGFWENFGVDYKHIVHCLLTYRKHSWKRPEGTLVIQ